MTENIIKKDKNILILVDTDGCDFIEFLYSNHKDFLNTFNRITLFHDFKNDINLGKKIKLKNFKCSNFSESSSRKKNKFSEEEILEIMSFKNIFIIGNIDNDFSYQTFSSSISLSKKIRTNCIPIITQPYWFEDTLTKTEAKNNLRKLRNETDIEFEILDKDKLFSADILDFSVAESNELVNKKLYKIVKTQFEKMNEIVTN